MSNYNSLKTTIDANIKQNRNQEITGKILNSVLNQMVTTLGVGYQFAGVATIDTNPENSDAKVFYIANGKGTYTNFGRIEVTEDEVVVLYYDTEWHKVATGIASNSKLTSLLNDIDNVKEEVNAALEGKQDTISDLDAIRQGAQKGSTALQSESDPIYTADKPSIALKSELNGKQDKISDLDAIREGAALGKTALQSESDPIYLADKPKLALKVEIPDVSGKVDKVVGKSLSSNDYTDADKLKLAGLQNYDDTQVRELIAGKANLQHRHTVADITDFPELYYDATAFFTSGAYPSDKYEELLEAVKAKRTVYATIDEEGYVSYVFFMSSANSNGSSSRVLLTTIFADGDYLYMNTFVLQQSGMTTLRENITGKANKATTLAGYGIGDAYTKGEVDDALEGKQEKLVAGDNITIVGNVISSIGGGGGEGGGGSIDLSAYAKKADVESALEGKQDTISDLATIRSGAAKGATALQSYTETDPVYMADKPSLALKTEIPDISGKVDKSELSSVATSGSYDDLINKPIIPSKTSDLTNDSGYLNSIPSEYVTETELNSKGYLTEHQDISGKADKATTLAGYGITDAYTKEEVKARIASKQDLVDYVNHNSTDTGSAESPLSLIPNVLHQWMDAVSQLYLSLATPSNVTVDEFMIQFTASGSGCTLSLPDTVSWLGGAVPTITAGKTYQISIINNLAVIGEF